jgi:hypothetical protein
MIKARNKFLGNCIRPYPVTWLNKIYEKKN